MLIDRGGEFDNKALKIQTKEFRHIRNEVRKEWSVDQLREDVERLQATYQNIQIRSVTATYNCVGMIFAARRTWIDPDEIPMILEDDQYRILGHIDEAEIGDIVIYRDEKDLIQHIGIVIERIENIKSAKISFKILSKWGPWAELIHELDGIPESWGDPTEACTDRRTV